jgi:gas vesicle structural protein
MAAGGGTYLSRPQPSGLAEVIDIILDKGLVIDAYVRVSLIGIEILTIDARIVIASVDTYLRFAEAVNRLDLEAKDDSKGLPELMEDMTSGAAGSKTKGALEGAKEKLFGGDDDDDDGNGDEQEKSGSRSGSSSGSGSGSRSRSRKKDDDG